MAHIRPYRDTDLRAVYDVCVRTANAGGDARGKYHSDDLMPDLFAGPYVFLEPDFAFVLTTGWGTAGTTGRARSATCWGRRTRRRSSGPTGSGGFPAWRPLSGAAREP